MRRRQAEGEAHILFCCELYEAQVQQRRFFLHKHFSEASSWSVDCLQRLMVHAHVDRVIGDQYQYGQASHDGLPVKKPTEWLSNSFEVVRDAQFVGELVREAGGFMPWQVDGWPERPPYIRSSCAGLYWLV